MTVCNDFNNGRYCELMSKHAGDHESGSWMWPQSSRHLLSQRFHDILGELAALHDKKQADYGRDDDPFANVRASDDFGVKGWVGALIRANDKMRRLQKAASGGTLVNESIIDSFNDAAVYFIIARVLYEEGENGKVDGALQTPSSAAKGT